MTAKGFTSEGTFAYPNLIAGEFPRSTAMATIASGQNLVAGALLGQLRPGTASTATAAAAAGNTSGAGAMTMADPPTSSTVKAGIWHIRCIEPATNAGTFLVEDPDGIVVGRATVAVAYDGDIKFTIADATDFVAGDGFTVTVAHAAGVGKYVLSLAAATDGSEVPAAVLAEDCDATGGDTKAPIYLSGELNELALTFGTGHTADSVRQGLRDRSIFLKTNVGA